MKNKAKAVFITGTDTGVGKSVITGLLGRYLSERGYSVITQKWIEARSEKAPSDIDTHLKLMKRKKEDVESYLFHMLPYSFRFPSSPHLASRIEKKKISAHKIKESFALLSKKFGFVIVEGIGGVLVPFNRRRFVIDIAGELKLPVLIVAGNKLGAINHTLLTICALRKRRIPIMGIIFNSLSGKENNVILRDNPEIIKILTGEKILGDIPWLKSEKLLHKAFIPIGNKILSQLKRKHRNG